MPIHTAVLMEEVLDGLDPRPGQNYVDCTYGAGGHSLAILERVAPKGKVIAIDWDKSASGAKKAPKNLIIVNDNYKNLLNIVKDSGIGEINGVLLDLGLSSDQLDSADRGFSFQGKGFLDLRYDVDSDRPTAAEVLKTYREEELIKVFKEYGEEPLARPIAKKIIASRQDNSPIETADMLVQLISKEYRQHFKSRSKKNPATRVFQALRIEVNDEYGNIRSVLPDAISALQKGGRLAVISFHSGEDRIVKHFFKKEVAKEDPKIKILTKRPIIATDAEMEANPRSRSAKLRVVEKII
jgi:16S rRNA (cytosine1402-N4)-methyltransferase